MSLRAYKNGTQYSCGMARNKALPFIFIDDAVKASHVLLSAPEEQLTKRVYNVQGVSFSPEMFEEEVRKHLPDFKMSYNEDIKSDIAASWPNSLNDEAFRTDFNWKPEFDLAAIVSTMIERMDITPK